MNKAYTRIDWENEPSSNTPINETNLNKMDSALDELDNRVITQDTSKADKTEVSTLIANVEFDESTGIITVTRKNGSSFAIDTKLEKIAINFSYDKDTQQIILTLIDGTKQYIDLSALITQYEFLDSDTITFVVQADGSIKAEVLDGSITENKMQSNYLAQIKVETAKSETYMNNASQSAKSSSDSENMSKSYAVGGTGTREGEDTDNAKYYSDNAKPLAKTITGTNPTIKDSTKAPLIYGKFNGYTVQDGTPTPDAPIDIQGLGDSGAIEVKTCGKNLFNVLTHISKDVNSYVYNLKLKPNTSYTCSSNIPVSNVASIWFGGGSSSENGVFIGNPKTFNTDSNGIINVYIRFNTTSGGVNAYNGIINGTYLCQIEEGTEATDYEPYTETTASIPITPPLYDGDYMEVYADGSGKLYRKYKRFVPTTVKEVIDSLGCRFSLDGVYCKNTLTSYSNYFTPYDYNVHANNHYGTFVFANNSSGAYSDVFAKIDGLTTKEEYQAWLDEHNDLEFVYELTNPVEEPLTAEQVEQFKQLYTFDNVTNVFCDGEVAVRYYVNSDCGDTVGMLQEEVDELKNDLEKLNSLSVGTVLQLESDKDIIQTTTEKYGWQYLGTSNIQYDNGSSNLLVTNVYRKNN